MVWAVTLKCEASPSTVTLPASRAIVRISEWRKFWAMRLSADNASVHTARPEAAQHRCAPPRSARCAGGRRRPGLAQRRPRPARASSRSARRRRAEGADAERRFGGAGGRLCAQPVLPRLPRRARAAARRPRSAPPPRISPSPPAVVRGLRGAADPASGTPSTGIGPRRTAGGLFVAARRRRGGLRAGRGDALAVTSPWR